MIDPMLFPGVMSLQEKIYSHCREYLNITKSNGSSGDVAACKRLAIILIEEFLGEDLSKKAMGKAVGLSSEIVYYTNRAHKDQYINEENKIYHFMYLNVKNRIDGKKYYTLNELFKNCIMKFPENDDLLFYPAKPLIAFLVRQNMSSREIMTLFGIDEVKIVTTLELKDKHLYLAIINGCIDEMTFNLKLNRL